MRLALWKLVLHELVEMAVDTEEAQMVDTVAQAAVDAESTNSI
jgi:hypothetical protein